MASDSRDNYTHLPLPVATRRTSKVRFGAAQPIEYLHHTVFPPSPRLPLHLFQKSVL